MKKGYAAILVLMLLTIIHASASSASSLWYMDAESVTVDLEITSGLELERSASSSLEYVTAEVSFIPQDSDSQSILRLTAEPQPKVTEEFYTFRWSEPITEDPEFIIDARVRTNNRFDDVRKIGFPYMGFPDDVEPYLRPGETIDSDDAAVIAKASELAAGETDYYAVVFRMADWTNANVEYDLSTLNIKASRKASWVLAKKDGVCDEITTLFIALLRAVGIPARFVSGIAYTESPDFPDNWGAHGWAEVYFPGTGWVPFDVTYGQYGFVDPTHIMLKKSLDSGESDTKYEWLGRGVDVVARPITVDADLVDHRGTLPDRVALDVRVLQPQVGIGSYNLVEVTARNLRNGYVADTLYLSKVNELDVEGVHKRSILLAPLETKTFFWIVNVIDSLDSHYTYTFPVSVANSRNTSAETEFYVFPGDTVFSKDDMGDVVEAAAKEAEKIYSKKVEVNCSQEDGYYYTYDDPVVSCSARNTGNFPFKGLEFCFEGEDGSCQTADLAISQEKVFTNEIHYPEEGINKVKFTVEGKEVSKTFFYDLEVLDEPDIAIDDIEYPSEIDFQQPYEVAFTLKRESASLPEEVLLTLDAAGLEKVVEAEDLKGDKKFLFNMNSEDLSTKPNHFMISVTYEDANGKTYTTKQEFEIKLMNVTFGQKMIIFVHDMDRWLRNLFK